MPPSPISSPFPCPRARRGLPYTYFPPFDNGAVTMHRTFLALCFAALGPLAVRAAEPAVAADLVVVNAKIWTVNAKQPEADALAVVRDRIVAVGKDADIRAMAGRKTRVL